MSSFQPPGQEPPFGAAPADNSAYAPQDVTTSGTPATLGIRAGARIIDTLLGSGIGFVSGLLGPFIMRGMGHHLVIDGSSPAASMAALLSPGRLVLAFLGPILYHSISESMSGATVGKRLLGLRVIGEDQRPISFGAGVIRNFAYLIDAMCFALVAYLTMKDSPLQQRLGDRWAHSVVVRVGPGAASVPNTGILLGLSAWMGAQLIGWFFVGG